MASMWRDDYGHSSVVLFRSSTNRVSNDFGFARELYQVGAVKSTEEQNAKIWYSVWMLDVGCWMRRRAKVSERKKECSDDCYL